MSPAQRQAAYEERCAKRKAQELKQLAEAERARRGCAQARNPHLADALRRRLCRPGGELRLLGLHDTNRYNYLRSSRSSGIDFIVSAVA